MPAASCPEVLDVKYRPTARVPPLRTTTSRSAFFSLLKQIAFIITLGSAAAFLPPGMSSSIIHRVTVTSHNLWPQHCRHFVGITRHNLWSQGAKI